MTNEQIEYENSLKELRDKISQIIDTTQLNAEKMIHELAKTKDLLDSIKNWKPTTNFKQIL